MDACDPGSGAAKKIDPGGMSPIWAHPRGSGTSRVQVPPGVNHTTVMKQGGKGGRAVTVRRTDTSAPAVEGPIKNGVEVTTQERRDREVYMTSDRNKERGSGYSAQSKSDKKTSEDDTK